MKIQSAQFRLWASQHRQIHISVSEKQEEREGKREGEEGAGEGGREGGWTRKRQRETDRQTRDRQILWGGSLQIFKRPQ